MEVCQLAKPGRSFKVVAVYPEIGKVILEFGRTQIEGELIAGEEVPEVGQIYTISDSAKMS